MTEVNAIRADNNLPPLKRSSSLDLAAQSHAVDMALDDYFDHDSYDRNGSALFKACDWYLRVQSFYPEWSALAENIAGGHTTPESVLNAWMSNAAHRDAILSTGYWETGVGYYEGTGRYNRYWVQDFGRRSDHFPLIINEDAAETTSRDVSLHIYGDWQEMRLRNDEDPWPAWRPFQTSLDWKVGGGVGEHTIWVELRDEHRTAMSSDAIYLASAPTLGGLSDSVQFAYVISRHELVPWIHQEAVLNVTTQDTLTWSVSTEGGWFIVTPSDGTTPASLSIRPTSFATDNPTTYTGAITVTVTDPIKTQGSPHRIDLFLQVKPQPAGLVWLPLVLID